jgi:hypothetical protein
MKRAAVVISMVVAGLGMCAWSLGQSTDKPAAAPAAGQTAAPQGKRKPQAKTQPEFDAYRTAIAITGPLALDGHITAGQAVLTSARNSFTSGMSGFKVNVAGAGPNGATLTTSIASYQSPMQVTLADKASTTTTAAAVIGDGDAAALEKAADDFAAKFPDSELRGGLYTAAMERYQASSSAKTMEMAQKILAIDADDPAALVRLAQGLLDSTRDTDLDKDQKIADAKKNAERALVTVETDVPTAGYAPEQLNQFKSVVRSDAYFVLGMAAYRASNWPDAETNLRKSIDAFPQQPDAFTTLELAISLDMQSKYPEATKYVDQAVELTKDRADSGVGKAARAEKDRLKDLSAGAAPKK